MIIWYNASLKICLFIQEGSCNFTKQNIGAKVVDFAKIPKNDENALQNAVATKGPVSVAICITRRFQLYNNGMHFFIICY